MAAQHPVHQRQAALDPPGAFQPHPELLLYGKGQVQDLDAPHSVAGKEVPPLPVQQADAAHRVAGGLEGLQHPAAQVEARPLPHGQELDLRGVHGLEGVQGEGQGLRIVEGEAQLGVAGGG